MQVALTPGAAAYARKRGGRIFVWIDDEQLSHVATTPPKAPKALEWEHHHVAGVAVSVPRASELRWRIDRQRFPWPRLVVWTNLTRGEPLSGVGIATGW